MHRIAVINQKGGVGKTTTTVNLGAALARMGHRVLLVDMDPQANLTVHVDKRPDLESNTLTSLLVDDAPLASLVQETSMPNLFVVPSDTSLAGVEQVLANRIGRETILREALDAFTATAAFDFLFLDCPPSLGVLSANALVAADKIVIPMQAEYLSLQGMAKLMEVIQLVQRRLNPAVQIACILPCMVHSRTNLSAEVLREIGDHFGGLLTRSRIRSNVKLAEAPSFGRTIFEHAPDSNGARDYEQFAAEFLGLLGLPVPAILPAAADAHADAADEPPEEDVDENTPPAVAAADAGDAPEAAAEAVAPEPAAAPADHSTPDATPAPAEPEPEVAVEPEPADGPAAIPAAPRTAGDGAELAAEA